MSCVGFFIKAVARMYPQVDQPVQFIFCQANEIADHVGDAILIGPSALKIKRQQREVRGR